MEDKTDSTSDSTDTSLSKLRKIVDREGWHDVVAKT